MKKRKLAAVLALAVALTVAGCGDKKESTQENTKTETQDTKTETDEATEDITKDAEGHVVAVDVDDISKYVTLGDYKNLEVEVTKSQVTDESVEQYIQQQLSYQRVEVTETLPGSVKMSPENMMEEIWPDLKGILPSKLSGVFCRL